MARKKREVSDTGIYHVLLRGVNSLFLTNADFEFFVSLLKQKSGGADIISYALLKNRIHMIVDAGEKSIGTVLKPIATSYARYCNRTRGANGKLFYDRFKSEPIAKEELSDAVAFVNFIINLHGCEYSSLYNPLYMLKERGAADLKSTKFSRLYIEDYDCLSKAELANYLYALLGVSKKDFKAMPQDSKSELAASLADFGKCSKALIYAALDVKNKRVVNKATEQKQKVQEKNLSVWLL